MTWTVKIEQDEDGSMIVPLPDELLAQLGVGIGDSLYLVEEYVGTTRGLVLSKTPQLPDRVDALVEHWRNEESGTRESEPLDQLTKEAMADVDAGRVLDHQDIQAWADALGASQCELPIEAFHPPINEADYDRLVKVLDRLLDVVGADESHPLASLVSQISDWIDAYDEALPRLP
jgi:predicted transcriptional regulator